MPKSPITIRYKDDADLDYQLSLHRLNALAAALHFTTLVQPERAPQSVPFASPRTSGLGGAEWLRVERLKALYKARYIRHQATLNTGGAEEIQKTSRAVDRTEADLKSAQRQLEGVDTSRGSRRGILGLYEVSVPPVLLHSASVGIGEGMRAGEMWRLDVRALIGEIREAVDTYLASGKSLTPCHYDPRIRRYCWRTACPQTDRDLLTALLGQMKRQDIVVVGLKALEAQ